MVSGTSKVIMGTLPRSKAQGRDTQPPIHPNWEFDAK